MLKKYITAKKITGRGVVIPTRPSQVSEKPKGPMEAEGLKQVIENKPTNDNLIKKLAGMKKIKRRITFIP
jgi:hypothetical protein